ncbi:MAG: hypothetical protein U9N86_13570, partial [Bacteroidota bacterium]|nr:hypothetical protein [Bacteroidota bacterium]
MNIQYKNTNKVILIDSFYICTQLKAQGSRLKAQGSRLKAQGSRLKAQGSRLTSPKIMKENSKQAKIDQRYLRMASIWAENSYCKRRKVGALIVKD